MKLALVSLLENILMYPPISLLRLGGYIKKMRGVDVRIIDRTFENPDLEMEKFRPDIMGIIVYTTYYTEDINFCKKMKEKYPKMIIIAGGPQITTLPKSMHNVFDYGVMGQGEISLLKIIDSITNNFPLKNIGGLVYWKNGQLKINPMEENVDFDGLATIDYNLLNKKYFKKRFIPEDFSFKVVSGIMANIGCPFKCPFCSIRFCWKKPIYRKIDAIVDEIKDLYVNFNVRHIDFYDDLFAINKQRLKDLKEELAKEGLLGKITFSCQARADIFDEELCQILKELNIIHIAFGFESGSSRMLQYIKNNPKFTVEDNKKAINICRKYGMGVSGSVMVGMPNEKKEDIEKTIEFIDYAKENGAARITVYVFTLFPQTEVWELAKKLGKIDENNLQWEKHTIFDPTTVKMLDESITKEEFVNYYKIMKKKSRGFVYMVVIRTLLKNPINLFYFLERADTYVKRYFYILKH